MNIIGMTITIETSRAQEVEKLLKVLKSMNISYVNIQDNPAQRPPVITKGNKKLDPRELFGIWRDNPRSIEQIRSSAWSCGCVKRGVYKRIESV